MNGKDSVSEVKLGPKGKELLNQILQQIVESNTMLDFTKVYVSNTVTSLETCHEDSSQQESFAAVENLLGAMDDSLREVLSSVANLRNEFHTHFEPVSKFDIDEHADAPLDTCSEKDVKIAELKNSLQIVASMSREAHHIALAERQKYQKHIQQLEKRIMDYEEEGRY